MIDFDKPITYNSDGKINTSMPINFSNDGAYERVTVVVTPDDRIQSKEELDAKYGPCNWVIKYEGFSSPSSTTSRGLVNPENPRRRVW